MQNQWALIVDKSSRSLPKAVGRILNDKMAFSSLPDSSVTIGNETFSLGEIPQAGTELVKGEKKNLLGELDLESFVADLGKLGTFIRLAYNGVAGNTELQIKVQRVGYKITKLTDESAVTVHKFRQTARRVLQELQGTYHFLLDGLEEMALGNLAALANLAEAMAKAAEELQKKFEAATTDVIDALEDTQRSKGFRDIRKKELQRQREEFELQKQKAEQLQKDAMEAKEKAESLYEQAQKREDEAFEKQYSLLHALKDTVVIALNATAYVAATYYNFGPVGVVGPVVGKLTAEMANDDTYKEAMRNANAEKKKYYEDLQKQRDIRRDTIQQCIEFAEKIKNCKSDEGLEEEAINALHNSIGALKSLSTIMMNAALSFVREDTQNMIERAMKHPEEKRNAVWTSQGFKSKGVIYYSKWVALDDVCGTYMEQIKNTRQDLYCYLQENPTIEQSKKNVRQLAVSFGEELKEVQEEIAKKDTQASKEMKSLQSGHRK